MLRLSLVFNSHCAGTRPRQMMNLGLRSSICLYRWGVHASISEICGSRLFGGRHLRMLQMYTSSRFIPTASIILFNNCPAFPTNGSPWASSSAPGASPINMTSARGLPTPKTKFVRVYPSAHFTQVQIALLSSSRVRVCTHGSSGYVNVSYAPEGLLIDLFSSTYTTLPNKSFCCMKYLSTFARS